MHAMHQDLNPTNFSSAARMGNFDNNTKVVPEEMVASIPVPNKVPIYKRQVEHIDNLGHSQPESLQSHLAPDADTMSNKERAPSVSVVLLEGSARSIALT